MKLKQIILFGAASVLVGTSSIASYAAKNQTSSPQLNQSQIILAQRGEAEGSSTMLTGDFVSAEKPTQGTATIVNEGGIRYLELSSNFSTSTEGPDLHVLLDSNTVPPKSYGNLEGAINLGKLKSYNGKQRYLISNMIQTGKIKSVVIWCQMANATFGYAPITVKQ